MTNISKLPGAALKGLSVIALVLLAIPVAAQDETARTGPFRPGWYVAPMATYMLVDSGRCNVDDGLGGSLAFGHRGDFASLELWGQYMSLSHGGCTYTQPGPSTPDPTDDERETVVEPAGDVKLNGGGLGLVVGPFFENRILARFFGIVGFGVIRREDHPQRAGDDTTIFGDAGIGYMQPLSLFGLETNVRAEARYRYDVQQPPHPDEQDPAPPHAFEDIIFNVGLQFALSPKPEPVPEPAPEPVSVVGVADADGDGVADGQDQCPGTAAGAAVNATGCAEAAAPTLETAKAGDTIVLDGVNFETGSSTLTANARTILDSVARQLAARPELRVEIGGHTDSRGSDTYNQSLAEQRAQSVRAYLTEQGVGADRLSAVGYGETQPVADNETDEGQERNRRVELKVLE